MSEALLRYYNQELSYLRQQGQAFAEAHPKIAARLGLGAGETEDPFVERLLEAFAFLTARIHHKFDEGIETITQSLLNLLYPHYALPIPSMSIVEFMANPQLEKKYSLPAHKRLSAQAPDGSACFFRTCYPVDIWPVSIQNISLKKNNYIKPKYDTDKIKSCLSLHLTCTRTDLSFARLMPDKLRFYIHADSPYAYIFYELLSRNLHHILVTSEDYNGKSRELPKDAIQFTGFADEEALLPYPPQSFSGYRLLTEFFAFPKKFLFFDIKDLNKVITAEDNHALQIHLFFDETDPDLEKIIKPGFLKLNCTPIINLFEASGEPIALQQQQYEYQVVAGNDQAMENIEVYAIQDVELASSKSDEKIACLPYFGHRFSMQRKRNYLYWYGLRKPAWELGAYHVAGTETFISVSDLTEKLSGSQNHLVLRAELLCSNRDKVQQLPRGGVEPQLALLQDENTVITQIQCLTGFSKTRYRKRSELTHIDLITHLNLNQICFEKREATLNVLKETLSLYTYDHETDQLLIEQGLIKADTRRVTERHPQSLRQGFCQGIEITLEINEEHFPDHNALLLGNVLNVFFQKACSINSFTKLILKSGQRGELKRWKPQLGCKPTL